MSNSPEAGLLIPRVLDSHAASKPEKIAISCGAQRRSWRQLSENANRVANALRSAGCQARDRIAILAESSVQYVELEVGIWKAGAVAVPVPTMLNAPAVLAILADCSARMLFVSAQFLPLLAELPTGLTRDRVIVIADTAPHGQTYGDFISSASQVAPSVDVPASAEFNVIYSSGTTGIPKGIVHSHLFRMNQCRSAAALGFDDTAHTIISTVLFSHWSQSALLFTLVNGGSVEILQKFDVAELLAQCQRGKPRFVFLVPVQLERILTHPQFDQFELGSNTIKFCSGSFLSAQSKRACIERWPGGLIEAYGMTEGGPVVFLFAHEHLDKLDSVGKSMPGSELKVIDENDAEVASGEIGEIIGRTSFMMDRYLNRPDAMSQIIWRDRQGTVYYRTGDLGRVDADGFLYIVGRKKDMIISGGLNIYPADIEAVLSGHSDVAEVAVIGVPDSRLGEAPLATVVRRSGSMLRENDLLEWANSRLNKFQRLARVEFCKELPRGPLGKVLKAELRRQFSELNG